MPRIISRADVKRMLKEDAQLVEVLPHEEFEDFHIPGAVNIPLKEFSVDVLSRLRKDSPVITYCSDGQ